MSDEKLDERFWSKVDKSGGPGACWEWTAGVSACGYGHFRFNGKMRNAHRVAYTITYGPVADGIHVCHACDNRVCCNPAHLWLGTNAENVADRNAKNRQARPKGELHGSAKLTRADVLAIRQKCGEGSPKRQIARAFGVTPTMVRLMVNGRNWTHV